MNKPNRFDEVLIGEEWTKAVMEPWDYQYINRYVTPSTNSEYNIYIAKIDSQSKGVFYRTKVNDLEKNKK